MARVAFEHVYKNFNKVEVVHDINLDVRDKEFLVLVGPSGCGKSTCLRMVAGLEEPTAGEIYIGERVVNNVDPKDRDIAMVFQNYALYPHMTVFDNMAFGLKLRHVPATEIKKRVEEAADILGLQQYLKRKPKELSGGQRQRVALGRALVRSAQVFLLDEPLSNLDAKLRVQTRSEIIKIHQRVQTTFIYVTHDQVEAMTMGTRIAVLNAGFVQQIGPPQELYDHPSNLFVEVPPLYKQQAREAVGRKLTMGIRPEHFEDVSTLPPDAQNGSTMTAPVEVVEHLGNELLVYMTGKDRQLVARLDPRSHARTGDTLKLHVENENMHLFDSESGEALF